MFEVESESKLVQDRYEALLQSHQKIISEKVKDMSKIIIHYFRVLLKKIF